MRTMSDASASAQARNRPEPFVEPGDERIAWTGLPVDCNACAHAAMATIDQCRPGHACVEDRYARRIDRFFDWNPQLSDSHVRHGHFEVRAIAAKHADIFLLPSLLDDPEEAVRWNAARRLPMRFKLKMRSDPHREVRIRVAAQLDDADLMPMLGDEDYYVRLVIARRISPALLGALMHDPEAEVRRVVASRLPSALLGAMAHDPDAAVRLCVAERMSIDSLATMRGDPDWRVRHVVASLCPDEAVLRLLAADADPLVRDVAAGRLGNACSLFPETVS